MSTLNQIKALLATPVAMSPVLANLFAGDTKVALFLSQFLFWQQIKGEGKPIYKTIAELEAETGLTRHQQDRIVKRLTAAGLVEHKLIGTPPKRHFQFQWAKLLQLISDFQNQIVSPLILELQAVFTKIKKWIAKICPKTDVQFAAFQQINLPENGKTICRKTAKPSENTTENTTENTIYLQKNLFCESEPLALKPVKPKPNTKPKPAAETVAAQPISKPKPGKNKPTDPQAERITAAHTFAVEIWFEYVASKTGGIRPEWTTEGGKEAKALKSILKTLDNAVQTMLENGKTKLPSPETCAQLPVIHFGGNKVNFENFKRSTELASDPMLFRLVEAFGKFLMRAHEWSPFHQKTLKLSFINSYIDTIIAELINKNSENTNNYSNKQYKNSITNYVSESTLDEYDAYKELRIQAILQSAREHDERIERMRSGQPY